MIALIASSNSIWVEGRQLEFGYRIMKSAWQMRPSENVDLLIMRGNGCKVTLIKMATNKVTINQFFDLLMRNIIVCTQEWQRIKKPPYLEEAIVATDAQSSISKRSIFYSCVKTCNHSLLFVMPWDEWIARQKTKASSRLTIGRIFCPSRISVDIW